MGAAYSLLSSRHAPARTLPGPSVRLPAPLSWGCLPSYLSQSTELHHARLSCVSDFTMPALNSIHVWPVGKDVLTGRRSPPCLPASS
eukprot:3223889-Pyramimonas_sp.AAC.1